MSSLTHSQHKVIRPWDNIQRYKILAMLNRSVEHVSAVRCTGGYPGNVARCAGPVGIFKCNEKLPLVDAAEQ